MECVVTQSSAREGVLDIVAEASRASEVRFQVPQAVLQWVPGQRFLIAPSEDAASVCTFFGIVMRSDAERLLVSNGGLLMSLPRTTATKSHTMGDAIQTSLVPLEGRRKRSRGGGALRPSGGA